ncbi:MAG TPA: NAD-dependent epimerase/dehydratase family protein [Sporichthya sp.]|nr:NAD-dependent epimerase/dehydratase family protein [Sporichthya sp.]
MRIAITGASGNLGTALIRALRAHDPGGEIVGICRHPPAESSDGAEGVDWRSVDLADPETEPVLVDAFDGVDAVVHQAWAIQPTREAERLHQINVGGTGLTLRAAAQARVPQLIHVSSIAVYAPTGAGPVTETWPATGVTSSVYSRQKVEAEALVGEFARANPDTIVSWVRPTLVVQRSAATEIAGLFTGRLGPMKALGKLRGRLPLLPLPANLQMQLVHSDDVADAMVRIVDQRAAGPFNLAADVIGAAELGGLMGARTVSIPRQVARVAVGAAYHAHAIPTSPGWFDMFVEGAQVDCSRARTQLGWNPQYTSTEAASELLDGFADGAHGSSDALQGS